MLVKFQSLRGGVAVEYKTAAAMKAAADDPTAVALEKVSEPCNFTPLWRQRDILIFPGPDNSIVRVNWFLEKKRSSSGTLFATKFRSRISIMKIENTEIIRKNDESR